MAQGACSYWVFVVEGVLMVEWVWRIFVFEGYSVLGYL